MKRSSRAELALPSLATLIALDFLGNREDPGNTGPMVEFFQRVAGLSSGAPWCAALVWACSEIAAAVKNEPNPLRSVNRKGLVEDYYEWASDRGRIVTASDAALGDLFLLWFPSMGGYHHMGFVSEPPWGESYETVEGNSNEGGSREGIEVLSRTRTVQPRTVFVRWSDEGMHEIRAAA